MFAIHSLYARVLLILCVALVPALTGAIVFFAGTEQTMLLEQMRSRGQAVARALANASADAIASRDYPTLRGSARAAAEGDAEIVFVRFIRDGRSVAGYPNDQPERRFILARAPILVGEHVAGEVEVGVATEQTLTRIKDRQAWAVIGMSAIFSLMGAILIFFLYRAVVVPIKSLTGIAARIEAGDLDVRSNMDCRGEVGMLACGLDRMAAALSERAIEIRAAQQVLASQNQELQRRGFEVARKNVELHEANRVKDEFLATMSHELRTPLNSVLGFLSLLREDLYSGEDEQRAFVSNAYVSASHLLKLVNDILDFTRMQSGKLAVHREGISVAALIDEVLAEFEPVAANKSLKIQRPRNLDAIPTVNGDRTRLRQVLSHLLENAIKFTSEGGVTINVRHDLEADFVTFEIVDTGIGLEPGFAEHAFEVFRQADGSYTRRYGGLGLGLCVSKKLVELMGGSIRIASDGAGRGTRVAFEIPCVPEVAGLGSGTARRAG